MFCDGFGWWVCEWCLVIQTCVLRMVVVLGFGHVSSHTHRGGLRSITERIRGQRLRTPHGVLQKQGIRGHASVAWVVF